MAAGSHPYTYCTPAPLEICANGDPAYVTFFSLFTGLEMFPHSFGVSHFLPFAREISFPETRSLSRLPHPSPVRIRAYGASYITVDRNLDLV